MFNIESCEHFLQHHSCNFKLLVRGELGNIVHFIKSTCAPTKGISMSLQMCIVNR